MNSALRILFFLTLLLTQSNALVCGPKPIFNGTKPSLSMPCGHWEDKDANDRLKNAEEWETAAALEATKKAITIIITPPKAQEESQSVTPTHQ